MKKIIKPKPVDSGLLFGKSADTVHLLGKVIGIYKKGDKQISKVLFQSSILDLEFDTCEALLGENVILETYVDLNHTIQKKGQSGKSKPTGTRSKSAHKKAG